MVIPRSLATTADFVPASMRGADRGVKQPTRENATAAEPRMSFRRCLATTGTLTAETVLLAWNVPLSWSERPLSPARGAPVAVLEGFAREYDPSVLTFGET